MLLVFIDTWSDRIDGLINLYTSIPSIFQVAKFQVFQVAKIEYQIFVVKKSKVWVSLKAEEK